MDSIIEPSWVWQMKARVMKIMDLIIVGIESMQDYVIARHLTLSEAFLFMVTGGRALWFGLFNVNASTPSFVLNEAWTPVFWVLIVAHFVSFFFIKAQMPRAIVIGTYAVLWCFLAILVAFADVTSPALPTFLCFSGLAFFIAVRMYLLNRKNV